MSVPNTPTPLLQMRGIYKRFSGVEVLHGVDLTLHRGEVLALMGENGAGKSTLMKILNGDYQRDGGEILIEGKGTNFHSPHDAEAAGVRVIYQELNYAPDLSVAENILMGHLPRRAGFIVDWNETYRRAEAALAPLKTNIDPRQSVGSLSVGKQQLVEIAKALSFKARILVMDEPTAALTSREVHLLFDTIANLREQGVGIVYISHRLDEVEQVAQRVNVLRDGKTVGDVAMGEVTRADIVRMMVGREVETLYPARHRQAGDVVLEISNLTRLHHFENVSFSVRQNEIVGLYGLLGAGQMEVVRALFGSPPAHSGEVCLSGEGVKCSSPAEAKKHGMGLVSEDRKREGLVLGLNVSENLTLGNWDSVSRSGVLQTRREEEKAAHWTNVLGIRARAGSSQPVGTLSGGNQQKVVLARWMEAGAKVLLLAEPTRGVDVGARADIYAVLEELREQGLSIVLVSTDMEEVLALSDRILVFERGRIAREFSRDEATQELLLATAAGEDGSMTNSVTPLSNELDQTVHSVTPVRASIWRANWQESLGLLGIYILLIVGLSLSSPYFLSVNNFINILVAVSTIGLIAVGMTMVIVSGGIDLSVGSVVALSGVCVAQLSHHMPIWLAVLLAFVIGGVVGLFNGVAITKIGINPLIATLGSLSIARGLSFVFSGGLTQSITDDAFGFLGRGFIVGIPFQVMVMALMFVVAAWIMKATIFGRSIYAVGGNPHASRLAGLPVTRLQITVYLISGFCAALGGIFLASQLGAGAPAAASGIELSVIAAVILGGTSLSGGKGTILGTLLGVLILGTLNNGLTLLNVSSYYQEVARGVVLLLAVGIDQLRLRWANRNN